jgi:hypothetical protein
MHPVKHHRRPDTAPITAPDPLRREGIFQKERPATTNNINDNINHMLEMNNWIAQQNFEQSSQSDAASTTSKLKRVSRNLGSSIKNIFTPKAKMKMRSAIPGSASTPQLSPFNTATRSSAEGRQQMAEQEAKSARQREKEPQRFRLPRRAVGSSAVSNRNAGSLDEQGGPRTSTARMSMYGTHQPAQRSQLGRHVESVEEEEETWIPAERQS